MRPVWEILALTDEVSGHNTLVHMHHRLGEPDERERVQIMTSLFEKGAWAGRLFIDASTAIGLNDGIQHTTRDPLRGRSIETGEHFDALQAFRIGQLVGDQLSNMLLVDAQVTASLEATRAVALQHNLIQKA